MLMKLLTMGRMITFAVTVLSSIPLFINYIMGVEPAFELVVHLHNWFGLAFIVFAVLSMRMQKASQKASKQS